jgi:hypothetical protein
VDISESSVAETKRRVEEAGIIDPPTFYSLISGQEYSAI